jgi:hypothetical protein
MAEAAEGETAAQQQALQWGEVASPRKTSRAEEPLIVEKKKRCSER